MIEQTRDIGGLTAQLDAAVGALTAVPTDELDEVTIRSLTRDATEVAHRLTAYRTTLATALAARQAEAARREHPHDPRAVQRASQDVQRQLSEDCNLTPADARSAVATGRSLRALGPRSGEVFTEGRVSERHVRVLAETLQGFVGEQHDDLERELLTHAVTEDAIAFGRRCRRRLAELDHDQAMRNLDLRYARRRASLTTTPEGTTRLSAEGPGLDAEILHTAIEAFRRPDARNENRQPQQRTWDALIDLASAAIRATEGPTRHGVRPHVSVVINDQQIRDQRGNGDVEHTGPLPLGELRRVLGDSVLSMTLTRANWLPLEVSGEVRTVPAGLWRTLVQRDGECLWPDCDMPARWCDVAHLVRPYRDGGRLTPETAGLLCRRHHRRYDRAGDPTGAGGYVTVLVDGRPQVRRADGRPMGRALTAADQQRRPRSADQQRRPRSADPPQQHNQPHEQHPETADPPPDHDRWTTTTNPTVQPSLLRERHAVYDARPRRAPEGAAPREAMLVHC